MSARYDSVAIRFQVTGLDEREAVLDLADADQDDPRIAHVTALLDWLQEKDAIAEAAAPPGDVLTGSG